MTDFLTELKELFSEKQISNVLEDFKESSFFREHYLTQTFKKIVKNKNGEKVEIQPSRFKKKSFFLKNNYPIQLNKELTEKLNRGEEIKVINDNYKNIRIDQKIINFRKDKTRDNFSNNLNPSKIILKETKELKMFIDGSNENPSQFETWNAEKMYKQWLLLRLSDIEKQNWQIMDYVFFLFINQISCILNSYILYGNINNELEVQKYKLYLGKLDEFTKNGGLYKDLLEVHLLFCKWYEIRIIYDTRESKKRLVKINDIDDSKLSNLFRKSEKKIIAYRNVTYDNVKKTKNETQDYFFENIKEYINELFNDTLNPNNYSMLIFTSYFQNVEKFNRLYATPIFPILGIPFKTHDGLFYSPIRQVWHDYLHLRPLIIYFKHLYSKYMNYNINSSKKIDDIQVFFEKMLFLLKLDEKKESKNAKHLLWWILHEQDFLRSLRLGNEPPNERYKLFFDIKKLKSILENLKNKITSGKILSPFVTNYIHIDKNNNHYSTVLSCIDLLIEVCDEIFNDSNKNELLKKIINETEQFYNKGNLNNKRAVHGNNASPENLTNISTLSKQRNAFIKGIVKYPRGLPLTKNNFSTQNPRNP
jgi:hypothetical protein